MSAEHLRALSTIQSFPSDHIAYLHKLKETGFEPNVIYDVGACVLHWTIAAKRLWPSAKYILFEAMEEAAFLYDEGGYDYHTGILSDISGKTVKWYQNTTMPGGNSYYRENNPHVFPEHIYRERTTSSLDDVIREKGFPLPDLVKIDVQGCEKDIILGGKNTLMNAQHLIIEMQNTEYNLGAPHANETMPFIEDYLGVKCVAPLFCNNGPDGDYGFVRQSS